MSFGLPLEAVTAGCRDLPTTRINGKPLRVNTGKNLDIRSPRATTCARNYGIAAPKIRYQG